MAWRHALQHRVFKVIVVIVDYLLPAHRMAVIVGDINESAPEAPIDELTTAIRLAVLSECERIFYPRIKAHELMTLVERRAAFRRPYAMVCRMAILWFAGYYALASTNTQIIADHYHIDLFAALIPGLFLAALLPTYRDGFNSRPEKGLVLTPTEDNYYEELKEWRSVVYTGFWSPLPSRQTVIEVMLFLFLVFGPAYVILQRFAGEDLARSQTWFGIGLRVGGIVILCSLGILLKRANRVVAKILTKEIDKGKSRRKVL